MKNIAEFAKGVVDDTSGVLNHTDQDWQTLAEAKEETLKWSSELAKIYGDTLFDVGFKEVMGEEARPDQEQGFAVWYENLVSGDPGEAFWPETCLMGLEHATAAVNNRHVIAMAGRVEEAFLTNCVKAFDGKKALKVYWAFQRVFNLAVGVMVDSYSAAIMSGMADIGINERLVKRIRMVAIRKMIDQARAVLPLVDWSESLSVGLDSIDDQHKKLVALLNSLHDSSSQKMGDQSMKSILAELTQYTVDHFAYEEKLFDEHDYAGANDHKAAHAALVKQVGELNEQFQAGKARLTGDLFKFLRSWLNGHIRGTDKLYASHLKERGVN